MSNLEWTNRNSKAELGNVQFGMSNQAEGWCPSKGHTWEMGGRVTVCAAHGRKMQQRRRKAHANPHGGGGAGPHPKSLWWWGAAVAGARSCTRRMR